MQKTRETAPNVVLMLGQRRRRCPNIKTTLFVYLCVGSHTITEDM